MNIDTDVIIVGSGAAGLTAALSAVESGANVIVIEKTDLLGGTTAVSAGAIWVPNNHHLPEINIEDSYDDAFQYINRLSDDSSDDILIDAFLNSAPEMVQFIEDNTGITFTPLKTYPDYYADFAGGKAAGRSLGPGLFDATTLGAWQNKLRRSPIYANFILSISEMAEYNAIANPLGSPFSLIQERAEKGIVNLGCGLIGQLLKALLARDVEPITGVRAKELIMTAGRVTGLIAEQGDEQITLTAKKGVVLASGGFEWNKSLTQRFLNSPLTHPSSPPSNEGDGLLMAMAVGSALGNMGKAWWSPSLVIPDENYENQPLYRADFINRSLPHAMIVNGNGERFVNESHNYNDLMKAFFTFDPQTYSRPNLNSWLILESRHLEKYGFLTYLPGMGMPLPEWLIQADAIEALAKKLEIDGATLKSSCDRFNQFARSGVDADFQRGDNLYDHIYSDPANVPNQNLGPIEQPPFYAMRIYPGSLGTKGGAVVNANSQVLNTTGQAIEGLYAAGNVMSSVMGAGYPGAGCTISSAMTFGYIAGKHAAKVS